MRKKEKMKQITKKGIKLGACAILAGGLAAGAFEGVNQLTGWNDTTYVYAEASEEEDEKRVKGSLDVSDIAEEAMPSVVAITTKSIQEVQSYYGMFGYGGYAPQQEEQEVEGSGSGIIIGKNDEELLVATNYHVVEDANTLSVCFIDGNAYEGKVKGFDEDRDLAVVSLKLEDIDKETLDEISVIKMGSSDDMKVGEQVVAIGNALGYGQSVTTGIVSAKNRKMNNNTGSFDSDENTRGVNLIQTDAAINPGNSGGALLNMAGELIGINSAKLASTEVEGMGYAIAISDVSGILENLMNEEPREKLGENEHGVLNITGSTVSAEGNQVYGIPQGVFVASVTEDGAAEKAGIKKNYVIVEFDGKSISSIEQLVSLLQYYKPGEEVEVVVEVQNGDSYEEKTLTVKLDKKEVTEEEAAEVTEEPEESEAPEVIEGEASPEDSLGEIFGEGFDSEKFFNEFFRQ